MHKYRYDAFGRRIEKVTDVDGAATTVSYSYGGNFQQVVEEQDDSGNTLATYVYGNSTFKTASGLSRRLLDDLIQQGILEAQK